MKTKKFVLFQLRSWLPMIIAIGALVLSVTVIIGLNASPYISITTGENIYYYQARTLGLYSRSAVSCIVPMMIPSLIASAVMPFFAYSHRYGKVRADCFLSLPVKNGSITKVRMLLAGAILLSFYLVSYLLGSLAAIAKQVMTYASVSSIVAQYSQYVTNFSGNVGAFGWYFVAWALGAIVVSASFLVNSFLIGQGSNVLQGVIALVLGHVVLCLLFPSLMFAGSAFADDVYWLNDVFGYGYSFFQTPAFYIPLVLIHGTVGILETNLATSMNACLSNIKDWGLWFGSISFLLLAGGALASLLLGKEPGGEYAGEDRPRNFLATLIPHLGFLALLLFENVFWRSVFSAGAAYSLFIIITGMAWGSGVYYVVLSLYNHSFKLDKRNWIMFAVTNAAVMTASLIMFAVSWMNG